MSSTTNDGTHEATALAYVEDAKAEDAKEPRLPIGVYGEGKYGECRSLTKEEIAAGADAPGHTFGAEKTEA